MVRIRSTRPGEFFWVEKTLIGLVPQLGPHSTVVYLALAAHADNESQKCWPSIRLLSQETGLSRPTVIKALKRLESSGLVAIGQHRKGGSGKPCNEYTLLSLRNSPVDGAVSGKDGLPSKVNEADHQCKGGLPELDSKSKTDENDRESNTAAQQRCSAPGEKMNQAVRLERSLPAGEGREPNLDHPAVAAYRTKTSLTPNKVQRARIAALVTDVPRWEEAVSQWLLVGYRPTNVEGMLDWYRDGIPERRRENGRNGGARAPGARGNRSTDWGSFD